MDNFLPSGAAGRLHRFSSHGNETGRIVLLGVLLVPCGIGTCSEQWHYRDGCKAGSDFSLLLPRHYREDVVRFLQQEIIARNLLTSRESKLQSARTCQALTSEPS